MKHKESWASFKKWQVVLESTQNVLTYLGPGQHLGAMGSCGFLQLFCSCEEMAANIQI